MTRINVVDPKILADQHLLVEYREITRVSGLSRGMLDYGSYTMGEGHVKFFYDKGGYLSKRCEILFQECISRGYSPKHKDYKPHPSHLNDDWEPDNRDKMLNLLRLSNKLVIRPNFYTLNKKKVESKYYLNFIEELKVI